ncbi:MAG: Fe(2+) transporter permease subunit FeoB [Gammaproteobacteria bacterium]|nr:Fe(2+) transporter permease subunit FeoB [Gammaproteobacteria bacterium]
MGCCESNTDTGRGDNSQLHIAIAGNPNCGKSALFNTLTGIRQKTGNWPGVTVDRKEGSFNIGDRAVNLIDLPGIYSFDASSLDEKITRDYLVSQDAQLIINVLDANNLERNLYFTVQLLELGVPTILALNMMDVARKHGVHIDTEKLSNTLGCPVVPVVATTGEGIDALKEQMISIIDGETSAGYRLAHDEIVEQAIADIIPELSGRKDVIDNVNSQHGIALKLLELDVSILKNISPELQKKIEDWRGKIEERSGIEADMHIADSRFGHAHQLSQLSVKHTRQVGKTLSDRIDSVVLNRFLGIPVFLFIMYLMFMFTINIGGAFIDFFDGVAGAIFVDGFSGLLASAGFPDWLQLILANGIGGGIQVVATFIPVIAALYLFLSAVEDSGYMARAAFVMDRFMRSIGLPGKAFVPLIVGFGCNVPAIMATRTLENERERKLTILMNPFMSCGARLPVYALFAAAFFPTNGQNLVFALYLIGIIVAILTGLIMKKTLLSGHSTGFMMELPPYHLPTLKGVALRTWDRVRLFIKEAGQIIIIMVLVLNVLNAIGTDGSLGNEDSDKSILGAASQTLTPVFSPMGISEDNWPAVLGIISGVLAKEVVVGTLDTLYSQLALEDSGTQDTEQAFNFWQAIKDSAATIPENLAAARDAVTDPLGLDIGDVSDLAAVAEEQEVTTGVFGAMVNRFDGQAGAFAYLLFVLLYFPCVATIGAIKREAGSAWAAFVAFWTTAIAYITASVYYQMATYASHPSSSLAIISSMLVVLAMIIIALRLWANRTLDTTNPVGVNI